MSWLKKIHTFNQKHFKQTLNQTETTNPSTWNLENHFCPFFFASPKKSGDFFPKAPKIVDALQFGSSKYLWRRPIRDSPWEAFVSCSKNWKMHMTKNSVNWGRSLVCCFLLFLCSFFVVVFVAICDFVVVFFSSGKAFCWDPLFFFPWVWCFVYFRAESLGPFQLPSVAFVQKPLRSCAILDGPAANKRWQSIRLICLMTVWKRCRARIPYFFDLDFYWYATWSLIIMNHHPRPRRKAVKSKFTPLFLTECSFIFWVTHGRHWKKWMLLQPKVHLLAAIFRSPTRGNFPSEMVGEKVRFIQTRLCQWDFIEFPSCKLFLTGRSVLILLFVLCGFRFWVSKRRMYKKMMRLLKTARKSGNKKLSALDESTSWHVGRWCCARIW